MSRDELKTVKGIGDKVRRLVSFLWLALSVCLSVFMFVYLIKTPCLLLTIKIGLSPYFFLSVLLDSLIVFFCFFFIFLCFFLLNVKSIRSNKRLFA